ncbi:abortive infection family protein [Arcicella aquatica]|uniref:Abortive infection family protein n=1 Tax=Arcicella aquatica TaxID=217141 RepID=A0ABU5QJL5_9BACT|nr:abortive infection family protein [Arcicella aquatica]MEA5256671.1 abortive infection family protein [Arcicella aquatica]
MEDLISPKYQMKLIKEVSEAIWKEFGGYVQVKYYISKWHETNSEARGYSNYWENFRIVENGGEKIDLLATLHSMDGTTLLKIAIDLGVDTPDFIPSIPTFRNEIKSEYKTAYDTFQKAYKQIETDPSIAIGLANSALESIIKEILKDERIASKTTGGETLYKLSSIILKEFNLTDSENPKEIKTIGNSLLAINQAIEKLRSEKTNFHGKTTEDYLIQDSIFAYFVINSVATVGLFLNSYYKTKYPKQQTEQLEELSDDLPF